MNRVLVVAGSKDFPGAAYLAGIAALRAGAESVIVAAPERVAWAINALSPDLMTLKLPGEYLASEHEAAIAEKLETADVLLVGNGMTTRPESAALAQALMRWKGKKVVDADALKALRNNDIQNALLTPNEGEWQLLQEQNNIPRLLEQDVVIVQKGNPTHVHTKEGVTTVADTHEGLTVAGTGDVLAGVCAAYVARGDSFEEAANDALLIGNAVAEKLAAPDGEHHFLASELAEAIGTASSITLASE